MRKEPAARCSATVMGWLAAASIEGGVAGVAHETMHRPPSKTEPGGNPRATTWERRQAEESIDSWLSQALRFVPHDCGHNK